MQEKKRLINQLTIEIEGQKERLKILNEHFTSVKQELLHMQQLVRRSEDVGRSQEQGD